MGSPSLVLETGFKSSTLLCSEIELQCSVIELLRSVIALMFNDSTDV